MAEDLSASSVDTSQSSLLVQSTGNIGGQDTTGPNFNNPNAIGPSFNSPNTFGPNSNYPNTFGPDFNNPNAIGPSFNSPNTFGPNSNSPNTFGPDFNNPNAIGPSFNSPNTFGPNSNYPNTFGPDFNNPSAIGPYSNYANSTGPNFNNPYAPGPNFNNQNHRKRLIACIFCCTCCCIFVVTPALLALLVALVQPPNNRIPDPGSVDFGPSRFDAYCNHTYNPHSAARPTRQTVGNRSFVTYGFEVYRQSYQYVVFELCKADGTSLGACTGSIIDPRHILTAAHCVTLENRTNVGSLTSDFIDTKAVVQIRMGVVIGRSNATADIQHGQIAGADGIYVHSDFDDLSLGGTDIALIRLNRSLDFNDYIKPVCLAGPKDDLPSDCMIIGFGKNQDDTNDLFKLNRASNVAIYSSADCSKGDLAKVSADQLYEKLRKQMPIRALFDLAIKWFLPIYFRGKLCSHTGKDGRNICFGDSGGPLLCTPKGVARNQEYHNPTSPLFRTTDPTLKQFGVNQALVSVRKCGEKSLITLFMSVKDLRLWLEFIAWPALQDQTGTKREEKLRYDQCIRNMNWNAISKAAKEGGGKKLTERQHVHICRKFNNFMHCADNSPKLEHCDHLYSTILNTLGDYTVYVDLLPFFREERCRQQLDAVGCSV